MTRVEQRVGLETVRRFLKGKAEIDVKDGAVRISAPSKFAAECIRRRFGQALRDASREETGDQTLDVNVCVRPCDFSASPVRPDEPAAPPEYSPTYTRLMQSFVRRHC